MAAAAGSQVLAQQRAHLLLLLQEEEEEEEASPLAQVAEVAGRAERLHSARLRRQRRAAASGLEPRPRKHSAGRRRQHSARPLRQHPGAASRSEVAEARPRQRLAARQQHLAGGGASPSEPPRKRLVGLVGLVVVVGAAKEGVRLRPPSAPLRLLLEAGSAAAVLAAVLAMRVVTCRSARWSRPSGPSHKRRGEQEEEQEQEQMGVAHAVALWAAEAADGAFGPTLPH